MQEENISGLPVITPEIDGYLSRAGWSNHQVEVRHQFLPLEKGGQEGFCDLAMKSPLGPSLLKRVIRKILAPFRKRADSLGRTSRRGDRTGRNERVLGLGRLS